MEISSLGKNPVQADQPAGSDARYEPEYEQLQAEIDKLSVPSASGGIEWEKVSALASSILAGKSKDLLAACYLALSQVHLRQLAGFADGLTVIHDLIDQYWEDLFPPKKRIRGRLAAIEWWVEKSEGALDGMKAAPVDPEKRESINTTLARIDTLLQGYFPEPPMLRPIHRALEKIPSTSEERPEPQPRQVEERPQPEPPPEPEIVQEAPKGAPAPTEPDMLLTEQDAQKFINTGLQKLRQAAAFLLESNPMNPAAYRYRRIAAWSQVAAYPPESDGRTQIPPPAPQIRQTLTDLRESGKWNALIISAEQRLSQFIFWFDLNRLVAEALVSLGEDYRRAHEAICQETAFLLHRLPGLVDLTFSDGTPFSDSETNQWLKNIVQGANNLTTDMVEVTEPEKHKGAMDRMAETLKKARALVKKKKLVDAVQLFHAELKNCFSQKEVLQWRLAMCRVLVDSKRPDMALPHFELMLKDIETYGLERWEPELALEGLKLAWVGYNKHTDKALKQHAETILSRIAELDPVEALKICQLEK